MLASGTNGNGEAAGGVRPASEVLGKVLANALACNTDQMSELQRERLTHQLEVPSILKGADASSFTGQTFAMIRNTASHYIPYP